MLFEHLPSMTCESPHPRQEYPRPWRRGSVFDHGGDFRRSISTKSCAQIMERDEVLGPSTPMVRRGRYRAISSTSRATASAAPSAYNDIVLKYFKHSGSTDCQNPGTISCCGADSLRTTTI